MTVLKKNGCHNRKPYVETVAMQEGWIPVTIDGVPTRLPVMRDEPFRMSEKCNYTHTDQGQADPGCTSCSWRTDTPLKTV